jgi:hypothetical protein
MSGALVALALPGLILGVFVAKAAGSFDGRFEWFDAAVAFATWALLWWTLLVIVWDES